MSRLALDTSAAVPFLVRSHAARAAVRRHVADRTAVLTTHSLAETYSVLTRLPGDPRVAAPDAVRLVEANFGASLAVPATEATALPRVLAPLGIAGGAVYDALVGLAARAAGVPLVTRDARALGTYAALSVDVEIVAE
ncbi:VapC toxin family PIN domain ribonuclease [Geodermatophilus sp. TF02-6]|uniref:PIN domain-containing protein n=1 Tax=Geodermatophilus sp. TF02-6 TaxID=2250575 RepID=UPI000DE844CD|nr:PIN domain-containing protein [Geodermatophilus sp. TF02-6]RBY80906.1 VapC toxin family PIN domain ribonuclease [Geodermatophilus sp. TF02-6]